MTPFTTGTLAVHLAINKFVSCKTDTKIVSLTNSLWNLEVAHLGPKDNLKQTVYPRLSIKEFKSGTFRKYNLIGFLGR